MESEESQLDLLRLLTLFSDVLLYHTPIPSFTYGSSVVTVTPELSAPQIFLELGKLFEQFSGRDAFVESDELADAVFGMEATKEVDVVLVAA